MEITICMVYYVPHTESLLSEANWKVLQANTSMLQPATMQPCLAYNSTPTQPYSSCNPTLRLQGVRLTVAILYCVYKHQEHSQHSCYCFYNLSIQCSWVCPTTATIPSTHQPVSSWCHLSVHIYMLNYCTLATLHNQTNTHPGKIIFHHVIINACAAWQDLHNNAQPAWTCIIVNICHNCSNPAHTWWLGVTETVDSTCCWSLDCTCWSAWNDVTCTHYPEYTSKCWSRSFPKGSP